jgi:hypothetical protein
MLRASGVPQCCSMSLSTRSHCSSFQPNG